jgi:hypothetical protein
LLGRRISVAIGTLNKKSRRIRIPWFGDSFASAYSLTGLPAVGRITLYLVIRGLRGFWGAHPSELHDYDIVCFAAYKSKRLPKGLAILFGFMNTQGEIESAISEGMSRFQQEYMGRGPKDVLVHPINDLVVCRLKGVLTAAEQHLVKALPADKGRDLLKQVRSHLVETARPTVETMV